MSPRSHSWGYYSPSHGHQGNMPYSMKEATWSQLFSHEFYKNMYAVHVCSELSCIIVLPIVNE